MTELREIIPKAVLRLAIAFPVFCAVGIAVACANGQDSATGERESAVVDRVPAVAELAGPGTGQDTNRSPLRFEMPRVSLDSANERPRPETKPADIAAEKLPASAESVKAFTSSAPGVILMAGLTFLPAALLMTTSFVRIQITLGLLRQALGSPSIPGNQVIVALSLLLSVLVMKPVADRVYVNAVVPYSNGRISQTEALRAGSEPIRQFMLAQIRHTGHEGYLEELAAYAKSQDENPGGDADATAESPGNRYGLDDTDPYPLHVVAPAFLLSELTTALSIGFAVYLPFLVVDLVVATVLAAMGIWMMPPTLISTPTKLILFVLADGWMLTAGALINGFAVP